MLFSIDIETTGLDAFSDRILCIGVYSPETGYLYFPDVLSFVKWNRSEHRYIAHRGSFDFNFLHRHGCHISQQFTWDTRSLSSILIPAPAQAPGQKTTYGLENLYISLLGGRSYKLARGNMEAYTADEIRDYNAQDCRITYDLFTYLLDHLDEKAWAFAENWLMPVTRLCSEIEFDGIFIDSEGLSKYKLEIDNKKTEVLAKLLEMTAEARRHWKELKERELDKHYAEMATKAIEKAKPEKKEKTQQRYMGLLSNAKEKLEDFNFNSSVQLQWLLRDFYNLDIYNKRTEKESTDEATLSNLEDQSPVCKVLKAYRELEKLISTCIPALLDNIKPDGCVHSSYHIGGTRTGRLSSSNPNLQQIPRGAIRSFIRGQPDTSLVTIDYAQIEVRIIAEVAKEKPLIEAFHKGVDPYGLIACNLFNLDCPANEVKEKFKKHRDVAKTAGLSILYGTGPSKLQEVLKKDLALQLSIAECKAFIENYRNSMPGVQQLRRTLDRKLANGHTFYNLLGRPFYIENNEDIYMTGLNTLVQGSASDLVLWSQTEFVIPELKKLGVDFKHRMLIHDEVVIELPTEYASDIAKYVIVPAMTTEVEKALSLEVPLTVEYNVGKVWEKP